MFEFFSRPPAVVVYSTLNYADFPRFLFPIHLLLPSPILCFFRGMHGSGVMTLSHATQPPELGFFSGYVKPHPQTARSRPGPTSALDYRRRWEILIEFVPVVFYTM